MNYHRLGGFKHHTFILLKLWRPDVQNESYKATIKGQKNWFLCKGGSVPCLSCNVWQFADYLWCSLASDAVCLFLSSCSRGIFPVCLSASVSKPPLIIRLLILNILTYTKYTQLGPTLMITFNLLFNTIFPKKVILWITGLGIQLIFCGRQNSMHNCLHRGQRRRSSSADSEVLFQTMAHPFLTLCSNY